MYVMYRCESWAIKKAESPRIDAFELWSWKRLLRVPWTARRSVNSKRNQPWIFIGKTDAEAPIFWAPVTNSWFIGKDPDAGKDWGQVGKIKGRWRRGWQRTGWHHWFNAHEFEQTPEGCEELGSLAWGSPCSPKEVDTTEQLKMTTHLLCRCVA